VHEFVSADEVIEALAAVGAVTDPWEGILLGRKTYEQRLRRLKDEVGDLCAAATAGSCGRCSPTDSSTGCIFTCIP
jgi:hypothetical protein